jgi:selenocysteine lyase/cysteine desulfurase
VRREASFLETGAPGSLLFAALQAGIRPLEELGLPAIFAHVQRLHDALEPLGLERGWRSCRARDPAARSGILSFRLPPEVEGPALQHHLSEAGLACALPDGLLRLAPHWANDLGQVEEVAAILDRVAPRVSRAQGA